MILIGNGRLATRDSENKFYENGAVLIDGQKIGEVGNYKALKAKYPKAEFIDAKGGLIMPALINAHEHIYSAFARGMNVKGYKPKNFIDILEGMWWNIDRHLHLKQTKYSALATYLECIKNGVSTVFDHHASFGDIEGSLFQIADASREAGIRSCLCYEISDRDGEEKMKLSVRENKDFYDYACKDDSGMLAALFGLHASFTISEKTMEYVRGQKQSGAAYHVHVAEGIDDLHDSLKKYGKRTLFRWHDEGVLGENTLAVHCVYVDKGEMDLLRETNTMVVHNPESNMGNACGCPPTMRIFQEGVCTGLGTDGYTHDILESYKVANVLHKHHLVDANAAWAELPEMLFNNNKKIANKFFGQNQGVLESGAAADVIVLDYLPYTPMDASNLNGHILFGTNGRSVVTTVVNGKVLMQDRELKTIDEVELYAKIRESSKELWDSING